MRTRREAWTVAPPSPPGPAAAAPRSWLGRAEVGRLVGLLNDSSQTDDPETALEALAEAMTRLQVARLRVVAALTPADDG
jgi:hypothetical protein